MEPANIVKSTYWIDELAAIADSRATKRNAAEVKAPIIHLHAKDLFGGQQNEQVTLRLGKLIDMDEPDEEEDFKFSIVEDCKSIISTTETQSSHKNTIDSYDVNLNGNDSGNGSSSHPSLTISFQDMVKEEEQMKAHPSATPSPPLDNAGHYPYRRPSSKLSQTSFSDSSSQQDVRETRMKYNTTNINCTLHELLLGRQSFVIRSALDEIQQEKRQLEVKKHNRSRPTSLVSFESLVHEHQNRQKMYNANAKEFVPAFLPSK